ncbi:MAG: hypothetical protein MK052_00475 [Alphaproteobacteria bacterium]|nr:hypothetical protein [Alphaproteobacteria bacterium]
MNAYSKEQMEESYAQVVALYDMAEQLISDTMQSPESQQAAHFKLVNPVVEQLESSTDILSEEFISMAEGEDSSMGTMHRGRIETAFRKLYAAMHDYSTRVAAIHSQTMEAICATVNPIIDSIKRHIEKLISIFVDFVDLSLDRIMQKSDLEQLRQRDEKIASILHNNAMTLGKST